MGRRLARLALGAALGLGTLGAATSGADPLDPELVRLGALYYAQYCATCHGTGGRGDGPSAPALRTPPADLTRIAARRGGAFPEGDIARWIDGRFPLPAHRLSSTASGKQSN